MYDYVFCILEIEYLFDKYMKIIVVIQKKLNNNIKKQILKEN